MMPDNIIHFKTAKKKAAYRKKEEQASENRVKFGRSKAQKQKDAFELKKSKTDLDGHKIDT